MRYLAGTSDDTVRCPKVFDGEDGSVIRAGSADRRLRSDRPHPADSHEAVVRIPRSVFKAAAAALAGT